MSSSISYSWLKIVVCVKGEHKGWHASVERLCDQESASIVHINILWGKNL